MVLPLRGCKTCRERRVKCDATRPTCSRCVKVHRDCVWDPNDLAGFHFKSENAFAGGKPRRSKKIQDTTSETAVALPSTMTATTPETVSETAFLYWVHNFVCRPDDLPDIGHEYGTYVLFVWLRSRPESSLHLALNALSHATFGRAKKLTSATKDAHELYAQSIVTMRQEMRRCTNEDIDRLLISIMLMGLFENITFNDAKQKINVSSPSADEVGSRFWKTICHHEGAVGLLKLRIQRQGKPSLPLDKVIRRQVIRTCILRASTVPEFLEKGAVYGETGPALEIDAFMVQVAALREKTLRLLSPRNSKPSLDERHSIEIIFEAEELDSRLSSWEHNLPEDWQVGALTLSESLTSSSNKMPFLNTPHTYTSHGHASVWNRYRAVRLIVNSIRARCLTNVLQHESSPDIYGISNTACIVTIKTLIGEMCASIPYFFNSPSTGGAHQGMRYIRLGKHSISSELKILPKLAWLLAWPLTVALNVEAIEEEQRIYLTEKLQDVAFSLGDAALESVAERKEFRF